MKVVHCKKSPYDIYIGGPSKWGNPFSLQDYSREEAISQFETWIQNQSDLLNDLYQLKGKVLGCWCSPLPCHGDILLKLANE